MALVFSAYSAASSRPFIDFKGKNNDKRASQLNQSNQVDSAAEEDDESTEDDEATEREDHEDFIFLNLS